MVYSMSALINDTIKLQNVLMILMEICLILEFILLFSRIMRAVEKWKIAVSASWLIISFLIMAGLLNDHRHRLDKPPHKPIFYSFPAYALVIIIVLLTVYLILAICKELKEYHNTLSPWSVYEAVNNVPCGVCFSDSLGRIILSNSKMQELCRMLTGNYLQNFDSFRYAINSEPVQDNVIKLNSDNNVFYFQDGSVWMFQEYSLQEPDCAGYLQTVAVNVSEIYYNGEKIRANNEKLEILNHKLEEMYEKIGDKIREQETLVMKMQVHDNFGRSLLSIRRILERKEDPDKMDKQLSALKHLVYILTGSAVESMEEVYKDTIRHAEELGISVQISGNFPMHPSYRLLTDRAIRECVTNCARHAHGSTVWVKIDKNSDEYTVQITNDGEVPDKNAEEGGGLSALKKAAESGKCRMQVSFSPEFCLILKMPLTERMGFDGTDTDSRRSEDHAEVF